MNKRVAIYLRVSTTLQNFEIQERDLIQYSSHRQFNIFKIYKDKASGAKKDRPELSKLLNDARKRKFDVVLVWRFDRCSRSTSHLLSLMEEFQFLGIDFISFQENVDTSSAMGRAMFTIISAISQLEKDIIRERVVAGIANARAKGKTLGRPKIRDDEKIKELRSLGKSYRTIATELNTSIGSIQRALKSSPSDG